MINSNISTSIAVSVATHPSIQAANRQSGQAAILPGDAGQYASVTIHPTSLPITHRVIQGLLNATGNSQAQLQIGHASGAPQVSQHELLIDGVIRTIVVPPHMYADPFGFQQINVPLQQRQPVLPGLQAALLRQLQHTRYLTPSERRPVRFDGERMERLTYRIMPAGNAVQLMVSHQGHLLGAALRMVTDAGPQMTGVRFSDTTQFAPEASLSLHELQWMDQHLHAHVVDHVVYSMIGNQSLLTFNSETGEPSMVYQGPIMDPQRHSEAWTVELHFERHNGRFALASIGLQGPGDSSLQTVTQSWARRQHAGPATTPMSATQTPAWASALSLVRARSNSATSRDALSAHQDQRVRLQSRSPSPGPSSQVNTITTINTTAGNLTTIPDDGFMHQDAYRQLLPPHLRQAMVCPPIAMGAALGFTVPFSVVLSRVPQAADGMTMTEVINTLDLDYGVQIPASMRVQFSSGLSQAYVLNGLDRFFRQTGFDRGVIEIHFHDRTTRRSGAHYISFAPSTTSGNVLLMDSRNGARHDLARSGTHAGSIAAHLANLYTQGGTGREGLSIRAFHGSHIPNVAAHRQAAQIFLQGPATTTTATTVPASTTTIMPGIPGMEQTLGIGQSEQARDQAFQAFANALALPAGWTVADLASARIEQLHGADLAQDIRSAWQLQFPEQSPAELDATPLYRLSPARPELSQALIEATPTLPAYLSWRQHDDIVQGIRATVTFLASVATQPVPTPARARNGANLFHLDHSRWRAAQPPGTPIPDIEQAYLLSHLMGEMLPPSALAQVAANETDPLTRMQSALQHVYAPSRARVTPFDNQNALRNHVLAMRSNRLIVQFGMVVNGQQQRNHLVLLRDQPGQWWDNTRGNAPQPLPGDGSVASYLDTHLWNNPQHDASVPIQVLEVRTATQDNSPATVATRQLSAYNAIMSGTSDSELVAGSESAASSTRGSPINLPAGSLSGSSTGSPASSHAQSTSATPSESPGPVLNSRRASLSEAANPRRTANVIVGESNPETLRRLEAHLRAGNYMHRVSAIRLLREMASDLSAAPAGSRTFTELYLRGRRALRDAMLSFLDRQYPVRPFHRPPRTGANVNANASNQGSDLYLGRMTTVERFLSARRNQGRASRPSTEFVSGSLGQLVALNLTANYNRRENLLNFEAYASNNRQPGETMENLAPQRFDQLARGYLRANFREQLILPLSDQLTRFKNNARDLARLYYLRPGMPSVDLRSASGRRNAVDLNFYRTWAGTSWPPQ